MDHRAWTFTIIKSLAWGAILIVGIVMLGAVLYMWHGSFEMYPTDEQQGKVRLVMAMVIGIACLVEFMLWGILKYIRYREQPNPAIDSDTDRFALRAPHGARHRER
jgi:hypothetical protein